MKVSAFLEDKHFNNLMSRTRINWKCISTMVAFRIHENTASFAAQAHKHIVIIPSVWLVTFACIVKMAEGTFKLFHYVSVIWFSVYHTKHRTEIPKESPTLAVKVFISQMPSSPFPVEWSLCRPPPESMIRQHSFTTCDTVWTNPHPHLSQDTRPNLCRIAAQRPWPVQK